MLISFLFFSVTLAKEVLFVSSEFNSVVNVNLEIAKALQTRGHNIKFAASEEYRKTTNSKNLEFISLGNRIFEGRERDLLLQQQVIPNRYATVTSAMEILLKTYEPSLRNISTMDLSNVSLVVVDAFCSSIMDYLQAHHIPYVVTYIGPLGILGFEDHSWLPEVNSIKDVSSPFHRFNKMIWRPLQIVYHALHGVLELNKLRSRLQLPTSFNPLQGFIGHPIIVTVPFGFEYVRAVSPLTHLVGFVLPPISQHSNSVSPSLQKFLDGIDDKETGIVVAFGSEAILPQELFNRLAEGLFLIPNSKIIVSLGKSKNYIQLPDSIPKHIIFEDWIDQRSILNHPKGYINFGLLN